MIIKFYSDTHLEEVWEVADQHVTMRRLSMVLRNLQFLMNDEDDATVDALIKIDGDTGFRISEYLHGGTVTRIFSVPNEGVWTIRSYQFGGAK